MHQVFPVGLVKVLVILDMVQQPMDDGHIWLTSKTTPQEQRGFVRRAT